MICFFIEHWLGEEESHYFNELTNQHSILFESDFSCESRLNCKGSKGRPFGGRCWVIRNDIKVIEYLRLSNVLSKISIEDPKGSKMSIFGIWQPFDDGSMLKLSGLQSNLSMLEAEIRNMRGEDIIIIGDFNADFKRNKRFDKLIAKLMKDIEFFEITNKNESNSTTYSNGTYQATIDHMFANESMRIRIKDFHILRDRLDLSDHRPIACEVHNNAVDNVIGNTSFQDSNRFHKFNWRNQDFSDKYLILLIDYLKSLLEGYNATESDISSQLNYLHDGLVSCCLKAARNAEKHCGMVSSNGVFKKRTKFWDYTPEISEISNELNMLDTSNTEHHERIKTLRRELRRLQRRKLYNRDTNLSNKVYDLLNNDRSKFWRLVARVRRNSTKRANVSSSKPSARSFVEFYKTLFSHDDRPSQDGHDKITYTVNKYAESMVSHVTGNIFSRNMINMAVNELKPGKTAGFNGISNEFLIAGNSISLINVLHIMFNLMATTGKLPENFNISIIIPIPKKKVTSAPSDYRPISISTPLCTIFEFIMKLKMPFLEDQHDNQFGYKKMTSCKSAYYVVNETINYYKVGSSNCHVVSLDAAKAFDKLW